MKIGIMIRGRSNAAVQEYPHLDRTDFKLLCHTIMTQGFYVVDTDTPWVGEYYAPNAIETISFYDRKIGDKDVE